jgi:hypothetical protein
MKQIIIIFFVIKGYNSIIAQIGINTNTPDPSAILDVFSSKKGFLPPRLTTAQRDSIATPTAGLTIYNTTVNCLQLWNGSGWICTTGVPTGGLEGQVLAKVNGSDFNTQWINASGQAPGTVTGQMQYWDGTAWVVIAPPSSGIKTLYFLNNVPQWGPLVGPTDVMNPTTGKVWMDRNLGASQVAISSTDEASYGHLYQWGRGADGHQVRTSGTRSTQSTTDSPGHGDFITTWSDWRSTQNNNLWQGVSGINNPCPSGFRLPSEIELQGEFTSWSSSNTAGAFASPLKLPMAGRRQLFSGSLAEAGTNGQYWSSTIASGANARYLTFNSSSAMIGNFNRSLGLSVRCIKD